MDNSGAGKSQNSSFSIRYNANNEELEEVYQACDDDPPTPQFDASPSLQSENASPKKLDKSSSIIDKYFKSIRADKVNEKPEETNKSLSSDKVKEDETSRSSLPKEVTSSPMKDYLNRLGKRASSEVSGAEQGKEGNETWKIFHDFKFKIAQAVEDMRPSRSVDETKEKSLPRENSVSDSEENSVIRDSDQQSVGDTDNQVSSLDSSIQNLSELTQPITAKVNEGDTCLPELRNISESSDDTHRNIADDVPVAIKESFDDSLLEVESGVEAFEETNIDGLMDNNRSTSPSPEPLSPQPPFTTTPLLPPAFGNEPFPAKTIEKSKTYFLTFSMIFLCISLMISCVILPITHMWNGFLLGVWFLNFISSVKRWLVDTYFTSNDSDKNTFLKMKNEIPVTYTIPSVKEHRPMKKYEGWINHYRFPEYDPCTYHISRTITAFMKLEGCNLRISYTRTKVAKRALWDEQIEKVVFYQHRLYNLTGARIILLPKGLVRRRQWSKKYPICVVLNDKEKIQVLEKEGMGTERKQSDSPVERKSTETETSEQSSSPEISKKKKFVWRKRDKIVSATDSTDTNKEGLRHRLARKIHKDKKTDSVSTSMEPGEGKADKNQQLEEASFFETEEELEGTLEGADGEWSLQVKESRDTHARLYLFGRTGREKHEWYRRLNTAIMEANAAVSEVSIDENASAETERNPEMTAFKVANKDAVAFAQTSSSAYDPVQEPVMVSSTDETAPGIDLEAHERDFWPYMYKVIQSKGSPSVCECATLPANLAWLNSIVARLVYDAMRDPRIVSRVQARIQRKLNTMKLPSFMGPLVATELSLGGACPMIAHVTGPEWDARGVWLDADVQYEGGAYITLLTQINLMKLKEKNISLEEQLESGLVETTMGNDLEFLSSSGMSVTSQNVHKKKAIYDSEVEDSAESSSDDDSPPVQPATSDERLPAPEANAPEGGSSTKKFLRMVDKITTSRYFQQLSDYKYVKRAMEGLSNTDIRLQLELRGLEGRLALNLPPPPHDRLWVGFRSNPRLLLKAKPAVGARAVRFAHITNWIEQKLTREFEKVLVLPNMEDLMVEIMTPTPISYE